MRPKRKGLDDKVARKEGATYSSGAFVGDKLDSSKIRRTG